MSRHVWNSTYMTAESVKKQVSDWAWGAGMWAIEEIGELCDGRLDLLLVPLSMDAPIFKKLGGGWNASRVHWTERLGLVGVEVKVDKSDFKNGLESGQFDRYANGLSGLYVAGPRHVVDRKAVPEQYGVIHVGSSRWPSTAPQPLACRRHPQFTRRPLTEDQHWRIIWAMAKQIREFEREQREENDTTERKIKAAAAKAIGEVIKQARLTSQ